MAGYDGSIRIDTRIDVDGMKKGTRNISKEFDKNRIALKKVNAEMDLIKSKMQKISDENAETKTFRKMKEDIKKAEEELDKLYEKQAQMYDVKEASYSDYPFRSQNDLNAAVTESLSKDKEYQKTISEIDKLEGKLTSFKQKMQEAKSAGGVDEQSIAQYEKLSARLEELQVKAGEYQKRMKESTSGVVSSAFSSLEEKLAKLVATLGLVSKKSGDAQSGMKKLDVQAIPLTKSIFKLSNMFKLMVIRMSIRKSIEAAKAGFQDLARYSSSFNSTMSELSTSFLYARNSIATAFAPALTALVPLINSVVNAFVSAANTISALTARIFTGAKTFTKAKRAQVDYAKSLDNTGAAAKKAAQNLAAFDELNILPKEDETSGGGGGTPAAADMFEEAEISEETIGIVDTLKNKFAELTEGIRNVDFSNVAASWDRLKEAAGRYLDTLLKIDLKPLSTALGKVVEAAAPITAKLFDGFTWFLDNIAGPLSVWSTEVLLPVVLELIADALELLDSVIEAITPALEWLWENFLLPIAKWTGGIIISVLKWIGDKLKVLSDWVNAHSEEVQQFVEIVGMLAAGFLAVKGAIALAQTALTAIKAVFAVLASPAGVIALVIGLIAGIVTAAGNGKEMIDTLKGAFDSLRQFLSAVFVGDWETAWKSIKNVFSNVINALIIILESGINLIIKGLNFLIGKINTLKIDLPDWAEKKFGIGSLGFNIKTISDVKLPRLPLLATGAVIPPNQQFMAVLGDQKHGRNLEAPESLIRQIMREEMAGLNTEGSITVETPVYLDGEVIYRNQQKVSRRHGTKLVLGGV